MKEQEEIKYINKHTKAAKSFNSEKRVISAERARAAVQRAYVKGWEMGLRGGNSLVQKIVEQRHQIDNEFNHEEFE